MLSCACVGVFIGFPYAFPRGSVGTSARVAGVGVVSKMGFMEKLLDGVEVKWKALKKVTHLTKNIKWQDTNLNYRYIDLTSVCRERKSIIKSSEISAKSAPSRAQKLIEENDVLFATTRPTQQRFTLVDNEFSGQIASTGYCVLRAKIDEVLPKWILYNISSDKFNNFVEENQSGAAYPAISDTKVKAFEIPIPCPNNPEKSLEIQTEIVRILDTFTELTTELTTELSARKKQYNYYRDQLLSFPRSRVGTQGDVEWKALGEIAKFTNGKGHEKDIVEDGKYIVVNSKFVSTDGRVAKFSDKQICPLFIDDILIVMSDLPNGKALAKTFFVDENERYTLNQRIGGIRVNDNKELSPKFLHYYLNRTPQLLKFDDGASQTNLRKDQILGVRIPIPYLDDPEKSLAEQARIVAILDKFDTLTNSISEGLPREIELRQKQYEYYRDLLLSFPKAEAAA